jgi:putative tryptophan/tyrosine transport system substrate-binding protein
MERRTFLGVLAGGLLAVPVAAEAQPAARIYTVGILSLGILERGHDWWEPFLGAMHELGYVEGRNLILKRASAAGRPERLRRLAADLVSARVDVIVTTAWRETQAAREATGTIPIVMTFAQDPVGHRLVAALARPGGNVTGLTSLVPGLLQKYVELLKEALPAASRFAVIASPVGLVPDNLREIEAAAKAVSVSLLPLPVEGPDDFEPVLIQARKDGAAGVIAAQDPVTLRHRRTLVQLITKHRLPAIYWTREYIDEGGLMTYSADYVELRRRAATYVDKILKGAKPADLPIEQPTKFEFVINLKTAKALGLTIPQSLLQRADQVIE